MRVIFVTREGYNLPGCRIRCYQFAEHLKKYKVETEVLSYTDNLDALDGKDEIQMKSYKKLFLNIAAFNKLINKKNVIVYLQRLNYHSFGPILAQIIRRNKLIFDMDDWEIRENPEYLFGIYPTSRAEFLTKKVASQSWACIASSKFLFDYLSQFSKRVFYIPTGVDSELFYPKEEKVKKDYLIFSWIGTMHRRSDIENIKFIIDCFKVIGEKYKIIKLEIVGDGIYFNELLQTIRNNGGYNGITLKGWVNPQAMPYYIEKTDVGLVPLIQNTKFNQAKSPVKLFEYMAMAKPTISRRMGESKNIIEDGKDGFLANSKEEFIDKMALLIKNDGLRKNLGIAARQKIERNYSMSVLSERLYKIIKGETIF